MDEVASKADSPDPSTPGPAITTDPARAAAGFEEAAAIMARLRAPGGCPWDRDQTFDSIRRYTLEEVYEVFDAIERRDYDHLAEELGDLLLQVLFYAEMAASEGRFTIVEVLSGLNRKLVRRHPHVFGEEASREAGNRLRVDPAGSPEAVVRNWDQIKAAERAATGDPGELRPGSRLDEVPRALPALLEASKLGAKAGRAGFDWRHWRELRAQLVEETRELETEAAALDAGRAEGVREDGESRARVEAELGDLLFTVVHLARHLGVDAEMALRGTSLRFRERFRAMETDSPRPLEELSAPELETLWAEAKRRLARSGPHEPGPREPGP